MWTSASDNRVAGVCWLVLELNVFKLSVLIAAEVCLLVLELNVFELSVLIAAEVCWLVLELSVLELSVLIVVGVCWLVFELNVLKLSVLIVAGVCSLVLAGVECARIECADFCWSVLICVRVECVRVECVDFCWSVWRHTPGTPAPITENGGWSRQFLFIVVYLWAAWKRGLPWTCVHVLCCHIKAALVLTFCVFDHLNEFYRHQDGQRWEPFYCYINCEGQSR